MKLSISLCLLLFICICFPLCDFACSHCFNYFLFAFYQIDIWCLCLFLSLLISLVFLSVWLVYCLFCYRCLADCWLSCFCFILSKHFVSSFFKRRYIDKVNIIIKATTCDSLEWECRSLSLRKLHRGALIIIAVKQVSAKKNKDFKIKK